jgi:hypothetical protein
MAAPVALRSLQPELRLHPRVSQQGFFTDEKSARALLDGLPEMTPFRGTYSGVLLVVDWDHKLPSLALVVRVLLYTSTEHLEAGERAYQDQLGDIQQRDKFPEFDVPDFGDLPADEAYEVAIDTAGVVQSCRLTSMWRRDVAADVGRVAVAAARGSTEFSEIVKAAADRPRHLGDLEAVSWTPPCETGHPAWTLDVWYLLAFDGRIGSGRSLLVDPATRAVVKVRDFTVRAG